MMKIPAKCLWAALLLALTAPLPAHAGEAIVNSEVTVDVTGKDAADARDQAMAKGQTDALNDLLGRFAPPDQASDIVSRLDSKKISGMIRSTQVLDEKISADRYRARLLVSFDADAISALVGKMGAADATGGEPTTANSFLIIPAYDDNGNELLWEDKNPWRNVWKQLGVEVNAGDIVVAYGDSTDSGVVNATNLASANYAMLAPLSIRYGASDIVVVSASYVKNPDMVLTVVKRRINRTVNEVNMTTYRADPQETRDMLLMRAARDITENLRTKKVEEIANNKGVTGGERNKIMLLASITTIDSWTQLRTKLASLPMVDRIELLAMSPQQVDMTLYYRGTPESLASAINEKQLRLVQAKDYWVVSRD